MFAEVTYRMATVHIIVCEIHLKQDLWNVVPSQRFCLVRFNHPLSSYNSYNHTETATTVIIAPSSFSNKSNELFHIKVICVNDAVLFVYFLFIVNQDYCPEYDPVDQTIQKDISTKCNSNFSRSYYNSSDIYFCKYTHIHSVLLAENKINTRDRRCSYIICCLM